MSGLTIERFVRLVDHTALKPETTADDVARLCAEAVEYGFAAVCINSLWVPFAVEEIGSHDIAVCSVVGFPLGAMSGGGLVAEAAQAVGDGASELDMVAPIGPLKSGDLGLVEATIKAVRDAAPDATLKVILETAMLSDTDIVTACKLSKRAGADFVKTSTGFNPAGGATTSAVSLMRSTVGDDMGVKASGGLRTAADAEAMVAAGASRLGMSAGVSIANELVAPIAQ